MPERIRDILLYSAVILGIILTLYGSLSSEAIRNDNQGQIEDIIAHMNGEVVLRKEFLARTIANETSTVNREQLDQFLAEEILIEKAILSGIIARDKRLRSVVLEAMREFVVSNDPIAPPSDVDLLAHYEATKAEYAPPARYQVRYRQVSEDAVQDDIFEGIEPTRFLPLGILRRSIGNDAADALTGMAVGDVRIFDQSGGKLFVQLGAIRPGTIPDFEIIKSRIVEDWYRIAEERQYDAYLQKLIEEADIDYLGGVQD